MAKTKLDIIKEVCKRTGIEKVTTSIIVDAVLESVRDFLVDGDNVQLRGFGTFSRRKRKAKECRDIKRNATIHIPEHDVPHFKPVREFTVAVANIPEIK